MTIIRTGLKPKERRWAVDFRDPWERFSTFVSLERAYKLAASIAHETTPPTPVRVTDTRSGAVLPATFDPDLEDLL